MTKPNQRFEERPAFFQLRQLPGREAQLGEQTGIQNSSAARRCIRVRLASNKTPHHRQLPDEHTHSLNPKEPMRPLSSKKARLTWLPARTTSHVASER